MSNLSCVQNVARSIKSNAAHKALFNLQNERVTEHLSANPLISEELWHKMLVKSKVNTASNLANRVQGDAKIRLLLKDRRVSVRYKVFTMGAPGCSEELADEIVSSSWFDQDYARGWLDSYGINNPVPKNVLRRVADLAKGYGLLNVITHTNLYNDQESMQALLEHNYYYACEESRAVFDAKPGITDEMSRSSKHWILDNLSTSRHLFDEEAQMRIVNTIAKSSLRKDDKARILLQLGENPNCHTEVIASIIKVKSQAQGFIEMRKVLNETIKARRKDGAVDCDWGKITNSKHKQMVDNYIKVHKDRKKWYPTLTGYKGEKDVREAHYGWYYRGHDQHLRKNPYKIILGLEDKYGEDLVTVSEVEKYALPKIEKLGERGWSTFFTLFLDWKTSFGALIDTTLSITD